jgi:excisionase family DNA binding protein
VVSDLSMSAADEPRRAFWTPVRLAEYLAVHERTLRQWLADDVIPSYVFEGSRRIAADDVDAYVDSCRDDHGNAA